MFEKVNPCHPDKVADRIAGAIVDLAYKRQANPRIAVEVLIGHGYCYVIAESSVEITFDDVDQIARRIMGAKPEVRLVCVPQDHNLADNQKDKMRCGDNGIFKGVPVSREEMTLAKVARDIYSKYPYDGKYIVETVGEQVPENMSFTICQSNISNPLALIQEKLMEANGYKVKAFNPLGEWSGGPNVDAGATNRKLGSDMGRGVTGGGLHGKDLSKADVSVNIMCHLLAQETRGEVTACCAIGDTHVVFDFGGYKSDPKPYSKVVDSARDYIRKLGGFEEFAEWGLIRP